MLPISDRAALLSALFFMTDNSFMMCPGTPTIAFDTKSGLRLMTQVSVEQYKIDFVMMTRHGRRFAIEIDGYTYHGATPEQFTYDSARQRFITERGYTFIRFSGQEVVRDPIRVAREALRQVREASIDSAHVKQDLFDQIDALPREDQVALARRLDNRLKTKMGLDLSPGEEMSDERMVELGRDPDLLNMSGKYRPISIK